MRNVEGGQTSFLNSTTGGREERREKRGGGGGELEERGGGGGGGGPREEKGERRGDSLEEERDGLPIHLIPPLQHQCFHSTTKQQCTGSYLSSKVSRLDQTWRRGDSRLGIMINSYSKWTILMWSSFENWNPYILM